MNKEFDVIEVLHTLMSACGTHTRDTIMKDFDATSRTVWTHKVFMGVGFNDDGSPKQDIDDEYNDCEMVSIKVESIWDDKLTITLESGKKFECFINDMNKLGPRYRDAIDMWVMLTRMIKSGDWSGEDPRTYKEDPMGSLSDYE